MGMMPGQGMAPTQADVLSALKLTVIYFLIILKRSSQLASLSRGCSVFVFLQFPTMSDTDMRNLIPAVMADYARMNPSTTNQAVQQVRAGSNKPIVASYFSAEVTATEK